MGTTQSHKKRNTKSKKRTRLNIYTDGGPFRRGEVVWGTDQFKTKEKDKERPFLVLTNQRHPFYHTKKTQIFKGTTERKIIWT